MNRHALLSLASALAVAAALSASPIAQSAPPAAGAKPVPRAADGKPDLSGIWIAGGIGLLFGEAEADRIRKADIAAGRPAPPPREPPPYKPEAEAKRQQYLTRRGIDDPMARCLLTGVPRITVRPLPFEIVQLRDRVIILYEIHHAFRIIPTDGRPHPEDLEPSYLGDSVARWDGDTLVVDVTNFKAGGWLAAGFVHSDALHLVERYTRVDRDQMNYEVTIEDPNVLTKPFTQRNTLMLREGTRLREYSCLENNLDPKVYEKLLVDPTKFLRKP